MSGDTDLSDIWNQIPSTGYVEELLEQIKDLLERMIKLQEIQMGYRLEE